MVSFSFVLILLFLLYVSSEQCQKNLVICQRSNLPTCCETETYVPKPLSNVFEVRCFNLGIRSERRQIFGKIIYQLKNEFIIRHYPIDNNNKTSVISLNISNFEYVLLKCSLDNTTVQHSFNFCEPVKKHKLSCESFLDGNSNSPSMNCSFVFEDNQNQCPLSASFGVFDQYGNKIRTITFENDKCVHTQCQLPQICADTTRHCPIIMENPDYFVIKQLIPSSHAQLFDQAYNFPSYKKAYKGPAVLAKMSCNSTSCRISLKLPFPINNYNTTSWILRQIYPDVYVDENIGYLSASEGNEIVLDNIPPFVDFQVEIFQDRDSNVTSQKAVSISLKAVLQDIPSVASLVNTNAYIQVSSGEFLIFFGYNVEKYPNFPGTFRLPKEDATIYGSNPHEPNYKIILSSNTSISEQTFEACPWDHLRRRCLETVSMKLYLQQESPSAVSVIPSHSGLYVEWKPVKGATSYIIYRCWKKQWHQCRNELLPFEQIATDNMNTSQLFYVNSFMKSVPKIGVSACVYSKCSQMKEATVYEYFILKVNPDSLAINFQTVDFVNLNWQLTADSYPHVKFEVLVTSGNGTPRQYSTLNTFLDLPCNGISDSDVTIKITTCMQANVEEANKECDGNPAEMKVNISCPSQQRPSTSVTKDIIDKSSNDNKNRNYGTKINNSNDIKFEAFVIYLILGAFVVVVAFAVGVFIGILGMSCKNKKSAGYYRTYRDDPAQSSRNPSTSGTLNSRRSSAITSTQSSTDSTTSDNTGNAGTNFDEIIATNDSSNTSSSDVEVGKRNYRRR